MGLIQRLTSGTAILLLAACGNLNQDSAKVLDKDPSTHPVQGSPLDLAPVDPAYVTSTYELNSIWESVDSVQVLGGTQNVQFETSNRVHQIRIAVTGLVPHEPMLQDYLRKSSRLEEDGVLTLLLGDPQMPCVKRGNPDSPTEVDGVCITGIKVTLPVQNSVEVYVNGKPLTNREITRQELQVGLIKLGELNRGVDLVKQEPYKMSLFQAFADQNRGTALLKVEQLVDAIRLLKDLGNRLAVVTLLKDFLSDRKQNWKKIAGAFPTSSSEQVQALKTLKP